MSISAKSFLNGTWCMDQFWSSTTLPWMTTIRKPLMAVIYCVPRRQHSPSEGNVFFPWLRLFRRRQHLCHDSSLWSPALEGRSQSLMFVAQALYTHDDDRRRDGNHIDETNQVLIAGNRRRLPDIIYDEMKFACRPPVTSTSVWTCCSVFAILVLESKCLQAPSTLCASEYNKPLSNRVLCKMGGHYITCWMLHTVPVTHCHIGPICAHFRKL